MNIGKSAIINKFTNNTFNRKLESTIGIEFNSKTIQILNQHIKLHIWDTAGQEQFKSLTHNYYRNIAGVIITYDTTDRKTFNNLKSWLKDVDYYCHKDISMVIVGTKIDLLRKRQVTFSEGNIIAQQNNALFFETSSKQNINIDNIFEALSLRILEKIKENKITTTPDKGIKIYKQIDIINSKKNCCNIM